MLMRVNDRTKIVYVRSYVRFRNGRLERVRAHYRSMPSRKVGK